MGWGDIESQCGEPVSHMRRGFHRLCCSGQQTPYGNAESGKLWQGGKGIFVGDIVT